MRTRVGIGLASSALSLACGSVLGACVPETLLVLELSDAAEQVTYALYDDSACEPRFDGAAAAALVLSSVRHSPAKVGIQVAIRVTERWAGAPVRIEATAILAPEIKGYWCGCLTLPRGTNRVIAVHMHASPASCEALAEAAPNGGDGDGDGADDGKGDGGGQDGGLCGNGALDVGEACDDGAGNGKGEGACLTSCTGRQACGDDEKNGTEACDDGPLNGLGDGRCVATCDALQVCGDGHTHGTELCDDGLQNDSGEGACLSGCKRRQRCGDQRSEGTEVCDDGALNGAGSESCLADCSGRQLCGDGVANGTEACDDGRTKNGSGNTWCLADCSGRQTCGDGAKNGTEACDEGGANGSGAHHCAPDCSGLQECGDARAQGTEACDQGANNGAGEGHCLTDCSGTQQCGDGVVNGTEECEPGVTALPSCLTLGVRQGAGAGPQCSGCVVSGCTGPQINSIAEIRAAIADAYSSGTHQIVAIRQGRYELGSGESIELKECGPCGAGRPVGLTLRPLAGEVRIVQPNVAGDAITVVSGRNKLIGLTIEACFAVFLTDDNGNAGSGGNLLRNLLVVNDAFDPYTAVRVHSSDNIIEANRFANTNLGWPGFEAVSIDATHGLAGAGNNVVAMNVISGPWMHGVYVLGAAGTVLDANTIDLVRAEMETTVYDGLRLEGATNTCIRNNLIVGDGGGYTYGYSLTAATLSCASGPGLGRNVVAQVAAGCHDSTALCTTWCGGGGPLCETRAFGGFAGERCLAVSGNAELIDAGLLLGYDMLDGEGGGYLGDAPEIGAREVGSARTFGTLLSTCP